MCSVRQILTVYVSLLVVLLHLVSTLGSEYDRENWVDLDDIMNYDRVTKTMISSDKTRLHRENWLNPEEGRDVHRPRNTCSESKHALQVLNVQDQLSTCRGRLHRLTKSRSSSSLIVAPLDPPPTSPRQRPDGAQTVYLRRFVGLLLRAAGLADVALEPGQSVERTVVLAVDAEQLSVLRGWGGGGDGGEAGMGRLDEVLTEALQGVGGLHAALGWFEKVTRFFATEDLVHRVTPFAFTLVVVSMLVLRRRLAEIVLTFLLLVFVLGYQYTYDYLIKVSEIERRVASAAYADMPAACRPEAMSWTDYARHRWFGEPDACLRYHTARMMAPGVSVTPTKVLSEMLSEMVVHPLGRFGHGIGLFAANLLGKLSYVNGWLVLLLVASMFVTIVVLAFGGRIGFNLPLWLGRFELAGPRLHAGYQFQESPTRAVTAATATTTAAQSLQHDEVRRQVLAYIQQLVPLPDGSIVLRAAAVDSRLRIGGDSSLEVAADEIVTVGHGTATSANRVTPTADGAVRPIVDAAAVEQRSPRVGGDGSNVASSSSGKAVGVDGNDATGPRAVASVEYASVFSVGQRSEPDACDRGEASPKPSRRMTAELKREVRVMDGRTGVTEDATDVTDVTSDVSGFLQKIRDILSIPESRQSSSCDSSPRDEDSLPCDGNSSSRVEDASLRDDGFDGSDFIASVERILLGVNEGRPDVDAPDTAQRAGGDATGAHNRQARSGSVGSSDGSGDFVKL